MAAFACSLQPMTPAEQAEWRKADAAKKKRLEKACGGHKQLDRLMRHNQSLFTSARSGAQD